MGVDAPEFQTHAAGRLVALEAPPGRHADQIAVAYLTHEATGTVTGDGEAAPPGHSGHFRDPLPASDGTLVAAHTPETRADRNTGSRNRPGSRYAFRLKRLVSGAGGPGGVLVPGPALTGGIRRTASWWDPDERVDFTGDLWELQPVEVRARPKPPVPAAVLEEPERRIFAQEGVDPAAFQAGLTSRGLGVIVSRDVTNRDEADRQQPFNLRVPGGTSTVATGGRVYDVSHLQVFQADQLRGLGGVAEPRRGRRVLARALHDPAVRNPPGGGPSGSVRVAADGSIAALVPARRALTWQLTDPAGAGVVRERYWLTVQPGEVRACPSCHGPSSRDQLGRPAPANPPAALAALLRHWKTELGGQGGCVPSPTALCLAGGRFRVEATWKDFGNRTGAGRSLPLTPDTGALWFFDSSNVEVVVKVIDGRSLNGNFWVFYGALSNVEYRLTVTDTLTGRQKTYTNPSGRFASVGDTAAFAAGAAANQSAVVAKTVARTPSGPAAAPAPALQPAPAAACAPGPAGSTALCLAGRFQVEVSWKDFTGRTGTGRTLPLTADTGAFSFFDAGNLEVVVKVLDGRPLNGRFWVFYGALSNVEYTLKVTDSMTGAVKTYRNPSGRFGSVGDTAALPGG